MNGSAANGDENDPGFGVPGGIYLLTVEDNISGCDTTVVAVIGNTNLTPDGPNPPNVNVTTTEACGGGSGGDIEVSVSETGFYRVRYYDSLGIILHTSVNFDAATETSAYSASGKQLSAGKYYIEVEDVASNGFCRVGDTVMVTEIAPPIIVNVVTQTNPSCVDGDDGSIDISVAGGTGSYTFAWLKDGTPLSDVTEDITSLEADYIK